MRDRIIGSVVGRGHIEAFGKRQNHLGFVGDPLRMQQGGGVVSGVTLSVAGSDSRDLPGMTISALIWAL